MRKLIVAIVLIAVVALPGFSLGLELGVSGMPLLGGDSQQMELIWGAHLGVVPFAILYASWDAMVMPPSAISGMTSYVDELGGWHQGPYLPGFLNLFDVGLRIVLGPFVAMLELGVNSIYVYKQGVDNMADFGANLRGGLGLKFKWWGVTVTGTSVFATIQGMIDTLKGLVPVDTRQWAFNQIREGLYPSAMLVIYL